MLSRIKYRFLGAVVLIGILLIMVPMLFDNAIRYQTVKPATPPPMPAVVTAQQAKKPVITPVPIDKNLAPLKAYTIQVASFKQTTTVNRLIALLQKDGFTAYSHKPQQSAYTIVFVGPVLTKEQAEALLTQLTKKYKVKPVITSYNPVEG